MTVQYRHTQLGYLLIIILGGSLLGVAALAFSTGFHPVTVFVAGVLALSLYIFSALTIEITDNALEFYFNAHFMHTKLSINEISSYRTVRNPWYYGWGIHAIPGGWVYNVSGFEAVELIMRNGRKYRVGTDDPTQLIVALNNATGKPPLQQ